MTRRERPTQPRARPRRRRSLSAPPSVIDRGLSLSAIGEDEEEEEEGEEPDVLGRHVPIQLPNYRPTTPKSRPVRIPNYSPRQRRSRSPLRRTSTMSSDDQSEESLSPPATPTRKTELRDQLETLAALDPDSPPGAKKQTWNVPMIQINAVETG